MTERLSERTQEGLAGGGRSRRRLILVDAVGAVVVGLGLYGAVADPAALGPTTPVLVAVTALPLMVRRLWPVPVLAVSLGAAILSILLGVGSGEGLVVAAFAVYTVAVRGPGPRGDPTVPVAVLTAVALLFGVAGGSAPGLAFDLDRLLVGIVALGGAWTLGRYVAERRMSAARTAEQLARTAVAEERLRISREIHDVVGHAMNVITVKAAVARHVAEVRPEETAAALDVIERTSRDAMAEVRRFLSVLRPGSPDSPSRPADLSRLVDGADAAGLEVEAGLDGTDDLPEGLQLAVYRIVQQALSNAAEHAPGAPVRLEVRRDRGAVRVEIVNGPSPQARTPSPPARRGLGLAGMEERAALYGGKLDARPLPDGGFRVAATFSASGRGQ